MQGVTLVKYSVHKRASGDCELTPRYGIKGECSMKHVYRGVTKVRS